MFESKAVPLFHISLIDDLNATINSDGLIHICPLPSLFGIAIAFRHYTMLAIVLIKPGLGLCLRLLFHI